jgi:putative tricarboxylic transport membrane protein
MQVFVSTAGRRIGACLAIILGAAASSAGAQSWKPDHPVELIVGCAPGCGPDNTARLMQRVLQANRYVETPVTVQNKAGAAGVVARAYLKQFEANGHYLLSTDKGSLASTALGRYSYTDNTPVAMLYGEYIGVAVKSDSPIKSGQDLLERLKKDPAAVSFGIATSLGNINHQSVAGPMKLAGIDMRKNRTVIFQSGAQAITAMLGGHIDAVPVSVGLWVPHMASGAVRVIAISAPERQPGAFAGIPTWREQGANSVLFNWRAVIGARGMTQAQLAFWEATLQRVLETPEWKNEMTLRNGITRFMGSAALRKTMDDEYAEVRAFLFELDMLKKSQ